MKFKLFIIIIFAFMACSLQAAEKYDDAWGNALVWLGKQQQPSGAVGNTKGMQVGTTALVLQAWDSAPEKIKTANSGFAAKMNKAADWLASQQKDEGYIADGPEYQNYSTSLAIQALEGLDKAKYADVIKKGVAYLKTLQADETRKFDPKKHITFGGFGYGSSLRPDLSNTWFALKALKDGGVAADDKVWKDAVVFLKRCQNSTEVNDQPYAGNDGGAMYLPNDSPAGIAKSRDGREVKKSFGSMTAALLSSYLMCGEKEDSTGVKLAAKWLADHYSVKENPGHKSEGKMAQYYYYRALAIALSQYGKADFFGHDWKNDLRTELLSLQRSQGYWINPEARFSENDPVVCTSYALTALGLCGE